MQGIWKAVDREKWLSDNPAYLMVRACPVCQSETSRHFLCLDDFQFFSDAKVCKQVSIKQHICQHCQTLFMNPCYSDEGFAVLFAEAGCSYGASAHRYQEQIDWLAARGLLQTASTAIDIGCGQGHFVAKLPAHLHRVGVDIDPGSIDKARGQYPAVEFSCQRFDNFIYDRPIDLITLFHVLEHLTYPLKTLQRLAEFSNANTRLVVEVPILEKGLTNDINSFFSVQHLTHFSRNSLRNILHAAGWQILEWQEQTDYNGCRVLAKKATVSQPLEYDSAILSRLYKLLAFRYQSLQAVEEKIQAIADTHLIIWGSGMHLEFLYQVTSLFNGNRQFIVLDSDPVKQNKTWRGLNILSPALLHQLAGQDTRVLISSYGSQNKIRQALLDMGFTDSRIICLYDHLYIY